MSIIRSNSLAFDDLAEIWGDIAENSQSRADAFIDAIDRNFHELAQSPHIGRSRDDLLTGLYSFTIGNYIIFYLIIPDGIEIVRVLHAH